MSQYYTRATDEVAMEAARRARSEIEKRERWTEIVSAARDLMSGSGFEAVRVQDVAAGAGVSKGTVFLYFPSKEALGLSVAAEVLEEWAAETAERLRSVSAPGKAGAVAAVVRRAVEEHADLPRLLGHLQRFEESAGEASRAHFRERLSLEADRIGGELERILPFLRAGEGRESFLSLLALVIGVSQVAPLRVARLAASRSGAGHGVDVPGAVGRLFRLHLEGLRALAVQAE